MPVIVLPGCGLLPGGRLPLYIFEPRYRKMLAAALEGDRMFCVGTIDERATCDPASPVVFPHSVAGLIRACVQNADGTSHLVLEGLQRLRFTEWLPGESYRRARVAPIESLPGDEKQLAPLCEQVKFLAEQKIAQGSMELEAASMLDLWVELGSEEAIADFVAFHLIPDVTARQPLVSMPAISDRLVFVRDQLSS